MKRGGGAAAILTAVAATAVNADIGSLRDPKTVEQKEASSGVISISRAELNAERERALAAGGQSGEVRREEAITCAVHIPIKYYYYILEFLIIIESSTSNILFLSLSLSALSSSGDTSPATW